MSNASNLNDKDKITNRNNVIDGKKIADNIAINLLERVNDLKNKGLIPGLAVIMVGDRPDTNTYVRMKRRKAEELGINFNLIKLDPNITEGVILENIDVLNADPNIHGIIVQMPLPDHIDKRVITSRIQVHKDVDGFHELNMGKLALAGYNPHFIPCTPRGVYQMIKAMKIDVRGKHVVVLGKSNIVGLPMALLLAKKEATVSILNADTPEEMEISIVKSADILISAVGKAHLVKKDWVKEGVIVIDIGINTVRDDTKKRGYRLVGDVDFDNVKDKASLISPVPGGVGPMTVIMLMKATIQGCEHHVKISCEA